MMLRKYYLSVLIITSLGYVLSRGGMEQEKKTFSVNFDVLYASDLLNSQTQENLTNITGGVDLFNKDKAGLKSYKAVFYTMPIFVGSNEQEFDVMLDTGSPITWVFGADCKGKLCDKHKKFVIGRGGSTSYKSAHADGKLKYGGGEKVSLDYGFDDILLTEKLISKGQVFGVASEINEDFPPFEGIVGLAPIKTSIFYNIVQEHKLDFKYSIYLSPNPHEGGLITFGGVDDQIIKMIKEKTTTELKGKDFSTLIIQMKKLKIGGETICKKDSKDKKVCRALLDTGNTDIEGPKSELKQFIKHTLKPKEDSEVKCSKIDKLPEVEIKIGDKTIIITPANYIIEYPKKCVSGISYSNIGKDEPYEWVLGGPFFRSVYTEFDFEDEEVNFYSLNFK